MWVATKNKKQKNQLKQILQMLKSQEHVATNQPTTTETLEIPKVPPPCIFNDFSSY